MTQHDHRLLAAACSWQRATFQSTEALARSWHGRRAARLLRRAERIDRIDRLVRTAELVGPALESSVTLSQSKEPSA